MKNSEKYNFLIVIIIAVILAILYLILSGLRSPVSAEAIKPFIVNEYRQHPQMEIQDLYKFIQQAAMGSEHAVKDTNAVKEWMKNEVAELDLNIQRNLIDTIAPDGDIIRINLQPYLKRGGKPEKLVEAFIKTANNYKGSKEGLLSYIQVSRELILQKALPFNIDEFDRFMAGMEKEGFPAVHHSAKYNELYKPAYRVIAGEYLKDLFN